MARKTCSEDTDRGAQEATRIATAGRALRSEFTGRIADGLNDQIDWANWYTGAFNQDFSFDWQYAHHNVCATMLTHALAQGDF